MGGGVLLMEVMVDIASCPFLTNLEIRSYKNERRLLSFFLLLPCWVICCCCRLLLLLLAGAGFSSLVSRLVRCRKKERKIFLLLFFFTISSYFLSSVFSPQTLDSYTEMLLPLVESCFSTKRRIKGQQPINSSSPAPSVAPKRNHPINLFFSSFQKNSF